MTERKAAGPIAASSAPGGQGRSRTRAGRRGWILPHSFALAGFWAVLVPAGFTGAQAAPLQLPLQLPLQEVIWAHPAPGRVQGFVIFISPVEGPDDAARQIEVGKPAGVSMGSGAMWAFRAIVPAAYDEFVAVAAVAPDGTQSPLSAWSVAAPTAPGQPLLIQP